MIRRLLLAIAGLMLFALPAHAQSYPVKFDSAASDNATNVIGGKILVSQIAALNSTAVLYWLKLYDKATAPTCATDTVVFKIPIPFGASSAGGGVVMAFPDNLRFQKGLGFCITANQADSDDTNAATGLVINFGIKQ